MLAPRFLRPESSDEAVELLRSFEGAAKVVAGSTAMTIMLRQGLIEPDALIYVGGLPGLREIHEEDSRLRVGALCTHREVELSAEVRAVLPILAYTFGTVANVRVRNAATVGGVVAEADYASDPPAVLLGLGADVITTSPSGERRRPLLSFYRSFYETELDFDELIVAIDVPIPPSGTYAVYEKYVSRASEDRPCVGVFASAQFYGGLFHNVRIAIGAASETPQHVPAIDRAGDESDLRASVIGEIAEAYAEQTDTLDDMRGSSWYRKEMIRVWVRRALERVREDAYASPSPSRSSSIPDEMPRRDQ